MAFALNITGTIWDESTRQPVTVVMGGLLHNTHTHMCVCFWGGGLYNHWVLVVWSKTPLLCKCVRLRTYAFSVFRWHLYMMQLKKNLLWPISATLIYVQKCGRGEGTVCLGMVFFCRSSSSFWHLRHDLRVIHQSSWPFDSRTSSVAVFFFHT